MRIARSALLVTIAIMTPLMASSVIPRDIELSQHEAHAAEPPSALVEQVRRATQTYRDVRLAGPAGYESAFGCVSGPQEGAMGVHYINSERVEDGELEITRPEALIYETRNGFVRLVGVEYIVKAAAWHLRHKEQPQLEGHLLHYNGTPNRYGLEPFYEIHVWAWRDNPNGTFVDWNPRVSCDAQ
jgi:hypothetical protein